MVVPLSDMHDSAASSALQVSIHMGAMVHPAVAKSAAELSEAAALQKATQQLPQTLPWPTLAGRSHLGEVVGRESRRGLGALNGLQLRPDVLLAGGQRKLLRGGITPVASKLSFGSTSARRQY